jgi:hypothetical protein
MLVRKFSGLIYTVYYVTVGENKLPNGKWREL